MRVVVIRWLVSVTAFLACHFAVAGSTFQMRLVAQGDGDSEPLALHHDGHDETLRVERAVAFDDSAVKSAEYIEDTGGMRGVLISLTNDAAKKFGEFTASHLKRRLAIIISGQLVIAPVIRDAIWVGKVKVTGIMSEDQAKKLALDINSAVKRS